MLHQHPADALGGMLAIGLESYWSRPRVVVAGPGYPWWVSFS